MTKIYALKDPHTLEIRYIGKTIQSLPRRLKGHMCETYDCYRRRWIKTLSARPIIELIEECDDSEWQDRERHWIAYYLNAGARLTNETQGGDGPNIYNKRTAMKISLALRGRKSPCTPERAAAISAGKKGKGNGRAGTKWSDDARRNLSNSLRGKPSGMMGKKQSADTIRLRINSRRERGGYVVSEETKATISANHGQSKRVVCVDTGEVFNSIAAATRTTGLNDNSVRSAIKNGWRCAGKRWALTD